MSRKKKAQEKKSIRKEERDPSPFDNIVLKEKKEPEKKKAPQKTVAKKPGEIVQGYVPSASFADILDSFEKTGNPYRLPKSTASSPKKSFGDILDQWEGKKVVKKEKKKETPSPRPQYKATRSFSDILDQWEGNVRKEPEVPKAKEEKKEEKETGTTLFITDSDGEKPSPDAVWSVLGGVNRDYVRKTEEKKEEKEKEEKPRYSRSTPQYSPSRSFGDILCDFEVSKTKKKETKKTEKKEEESAKPALPKEEFIPPEENDFFLEKDEDHPISSSIVWSVMGGVNENFVRVEEKKEEKEEPPFQTKEEKKIESKPYVPTKSFSEILSQYEKCVEKKEESDSRPLPPSEPFEAPESDGLFLKETDEEKVSPLVVWSVMGGINQSFVRKEEKKEEDNSQEKDAEMPRATRPYEPKKKFSSILSSFEKKSGGAPTEKTFEEILKEKGDKGRTKARVYTQNELRAMNPQATLDLHGENKAESREEVSAFLSSSLESGLRKISIITGKGLHSQDGQGVLKSVVEEVLKESSFVSEVSSAPLNKGGSGALWIILKEKSN